MSIDNGLAVMFVNHYNDANKRGVKYIPCTDVAKEVMLRLYKRFVSDKTVVPIEELSQEEKQSLVDEYRLVEKEYTNETLIESSKILYTIRLINDNS